MKTAEYHSVQVVLNKSDWRQLIVDRINPITTELRRLSQELERFEQPDDARRLRPLSRCPSYAIDEAIMSIGAAVDRIDHIVELEGK